MLYAKLKCVNKETETIQLILGPAHTGAKSKELSKHRMGQLQDIQEHTNSC